LNKRLLIVDDHLLFAEALSYLLKGFDESLVVDVAGSLARGLERLSEGAMPDLVLLDYAMPEVGGLDALHQIKSVAPGVSVAFLSGLDEPGLVGEAMEKGALGWLSKSMGGKTMMLAMRLLLAGERFVPANLVFSDDRPGLTQREKDVAALLAQGLADKQIADRLDLQLGTIKVHVKNLLRKYGTENRTRFALTYRRG